MKQLRTNTLTQLELTGKSLGPTEGFVIAELVKFSTVLKKLNLMGNSDLRDAKQLMRDAVSGRDGFELRDP